MSHAVVSWCFTSAIFASAMLLFCVQPMITKMVLPRLGGAASVWTTCMMFFQGALLVGYAYATALVRLPGRAQVAVHLAVVGAAALALPLELREVAAWERATQPTLWLLGALTLTVGVPFFVTSTTSPLLRAWFSRTNHPRAQDPYHLYAASNVGSIVSLVLYVAALEPAAGLGWQSALWAGGYALFAALMLGCAMLMLRRSGGVGSEARAAVIPLEATEREHRPGWRRWLRWVGWAFVPSSMMLAVTQHISTDIAPLPLFWVVPLILYLLSFVVVFGRGGQRPWWNTAFWLFVPVLLLLMSDLGGAVLFRLVATNVGLLLTSLVFHGALAQDRPAPRYLTGFYLLMSVGGMLGGVFNSLIAPLVFDGFYDYALIALVAVAAMPRSSFEQASLWARAHVAPAAAVMTALGLGSYAALTGAQHLENLAYVVLVLVLLSILLCRYPRTGQFLAALAMAGFLAQSAGWFNLDERLNIRYRHRSFFGSQYVRDFEGCRTMYHGTTAHGAQSLREDARHLPQSYYHPGSPVAQVFSEVLEPGEDRIAVVGLGVGALCGYWHEGMAFTFYELDPAVIKLARNTKLFTYLTRCGEPQIRVGDARITLERERDESFDLLVEDAFSSDAIPVHLLTREALELYQHKLAPGGLLLFHISNRYLDLRGLLARLTKEAQMTALVQVHRSDRESNGDGEEGTCRPLSSIWVLVSSDSQRMEKLAARDPRWKRLVPGPGAPLWTDSTSSLLDVVRWQGDEFEQR